ncbi:hypothetical protein HGRIS_003914 [Hohenbuehelia grisea]|uniref:Uncharacterized protein n=1 Tax=Hohenbuehelia grisea TaxID=104357 RepID=A0ABR3JII1_9AGAR
MHDATPWNNCEPRNALPIAPPLALTGEKFAPEPRKESDNYFTHFQVQNISTPRFEMLSSELQRLGGPLDRVHHPGNSARCASHRQQPQYVCRVASLSGSLPVPGLHRPWWRPLLVPTGSN